MILDSISRFENYQSVHPLFSLVLQYLKSGQLNRLSMGNHEIGQGARVGINKYMTKSDSFVECHHRFIDIQMILSGVEKIGYTQKENCHQFPYEEDKDLQVLQGECDFFTIKPGMFVVFFPDDGHMPCIQEDSDPVEVTKVVFKIPV